MRITPTLMPVLAEFSQTKIHTLASTLFLRVATGFLMKMDFQINWLLFWKDYGNLQRQCKYDLVRWQKRVQVCGFLVGKRSPCDGFLCWRKWKLIEKQKIKYTSNVVMERDYANAKDGTNGILPTKKPHSCRQILFLWVPKCCEKLGYQTLEIAVRYWYGTDKNTFMLLFKFRLSASIPPFQSDKVRKENVEF